VIQAWTLRGSREITRRPQDIGTEDDLPDGAIVQIEATDTVTSVAIADKLGLTLYSIGAFNLENGLGVAHEGIVVALAAEAFIVSPKVGGEGLRPIVTKEDFITDQDSKGTRNGFSRYLRLALGLPIIGPGTINTSGIVPRIEVTA